MTINENSRPKAADNPISFRQIRLFQETLNKCLLLKIVLLSLLLIVTISGVSYYSQHLFEMQDSSAPCIY